VANFEQKEVNLFGVMGVFDVALPEEVSWQADDIDNALHKGVIFRGGTSVDGTYSSEGYVLFCDVSRDAEEPDIDQLATEGVPDVEAKLRMALGRQFEILRAGETKLLKNNVGKNVLISTYIVNDGEKELALISLRTSISGVKWISVCACSPESTVREPLMQVATQTFRL